MCTHLQMHLLILNSFKHVHVSSKRVNILVYYYYYYCDIYLCSGIVQQVQFNLQLSEEERNERAKVVLPFEHQGMRTLNRDRN